MDRPDEILQRLIEDGRVRRALQTIASSSSSLDREAILRRYLSLTQSALPPLPQQEEVVPPAQATPPTITFSLGDISRLTDVLRAANQLQYEQLQQQQLQAQQQQQLQAQQQQLEQLGSLTDVLRDIARNSANPVTNPSAHSVSQTLSSLQGFSTSHQLPHQEQQQQQQTQTRSISGLASDITIDSVIRCLATASQSSQHSLASAPGRGNLRTHHLESARRSTLHTPASSMSSMTSECSDLFHQRSNATGSINFSFPQVNFHQAQLSGPASSQLTGPASSQLSGPASSQLSGPASSQLSGPASSQLSGPASSQLSGPASSQFSGPASSQLSGPASHRLSFTPLTELGLASVAASLIAHNLHHNPLSQLSTGTSSSAGGSSPRFPISTANSEAATAAGIGPEQGQQQHNFASSGDSVAASSSSSLMESDLTLQQQQTQQLQPQVTNVSSNANSSASQNSHNNHSFPRILYELLVDTEREGKEGIVSFTESGRAFRIKDATAFIKEIVPKYFRQKHLSSFKRQLSMYGFERIPRGPEEGAYTHEYFRRGHPELTNKIKRVKNAGSTVPPRPAVWEPDFSFLKDSGSP